MGVEDAGGKCDVGGKFGFGAMSEDWERTRGLMEKLRCGGIVYLKVGQCVVVGVSDVCGYLALPFWRRKIHQTKLKYWTIYYSRDSLSLYVYEKRFRIAIL